MVSKNSGQWGEEGWKSGRAEGRKREDGKKQWSVISGEGWKMGRVSEWDFYRTHYSFA